MFGFKKKGTPVHRPVEGEVIELSQVNDPVFSQGTMGPGFAVTPTGTTVTAPVDGELFMLFPTAHAFAVRTAEGAELLVHVGVDTVNLKGAGFTAKASQGDTVRAGQPIVEFDPSVAANPSVVSMDVIVVLTNHKKFALSEIEKKADPLARITAA